jgi:DNA-binding transcriptional ArsR family regulator
MVTQTRKQQVTVFRAIADPTRREILGMLRGRQRTVGEIAANFRASRPAISKHLRILRAVGLVSTRQEGTARICVLNARPLRVVNDWLGEYEAFWGGTLRGLKRYVEEDR